MQSKARSSRLYLSAGAHSGGAVRTTYARRLWTGKYYIYVHVLYIICILTILMHILVIVIIRTSSICLQPIRQLHVPLLPIRHAGQFSNASAE